MGMCRRKGSSCSSVPALSLTPQLCKPIPIRANPLIKNKKSFKPRIRLGKGMIQTGARSCHEQREELGGGEK